MAKKFVLNRNGVRNLLKSEGVVAVVRSHAEETLNNCKGVSGYEMEERRYPERIGYVVIAKEYPAIGNNLKHNTLLRALK